METVKLNVNVDPNTNEIEIREGAALQLLPPLKLAISGSIESVLRFLERRIATLNQLSCRIETNRKESIIVLFINETDPYTYGTVKGRLIKDDDFLEFGINSGKVWSLINLSNFIKMHRHCFEDPSVAMKLVHELLAFKGKVNTELEKVKDTRGNTRILLDQVVESNIPKGFTLNIPIFKNESFRRFNVEINIVVRDAEMECYLESVEANDLIKETVKTAINQQLDLILGIAPEIVQIEV